MKLIMLTVCVETCASTGSTQTIVLGVFDDPKLLWSATERYTKNNLKKRICFNEKIVSLNTYDPYPQYY